MRVLALPGVFRPISDSWQLAEIAGERVRERLAATAGAGAGVPTRVRALEVGTGAGAIAATMARAGADVTAIDVSRRALASAWLTARVNGVRVRVRRGSLLAPVAGERFDLIVSNPPYVPGPAPERARGAARAWEAGSDGRALLDPLITVAARHLRPGGALLVVHSTINGEAETVARMRAAGLTARVAARHAGPLGPLMRAALTASQTAPPGAVDGWEEVLVIEGLLASAPDDRTRRFDHPARRWAGAGAGLGHHRG